MLVRVEQTSVLPIAFETEHAGESGADFSFAYSF